MCVEALVLPHEPGGDPLQPADMPEAVSAEDKLAKRILSGTGFCGHYMHFHGGGVSGKAPIICLLAKQPGGEMSQQELGMHFDLKPGSLSEILSKLELNGLIERSRNPKDRRQLTIRLTETGRENARIDRAARIRFRERAFSALTHDEREDLAEMLDKIRVTGRNWMIKTLMGSIRDYMKVAVATPLLVLGEVLCEMLIPFITANLIDAIKDGTTVAEMLPTAGFLVLIALTSLAFGAAAGVTCSHASCGFAKNLRHDLFYKIQTFSFANIDEFSSSSLVTRLTTDINNVQQAFMMIIRIAVRAPLVLIFAFTMAFIMGGSVAMVYWSSFRCWALDCSLSSLRYAPSSRACSTSTTHLTSLSKKTSPACAWSRAMCAKTLRRRNSRPPRATSRWTSPAPRSCSPLTTP